MTNPALASDPRTARAFAEWEKDIGTPALADPRSSMGFKGLLYPSEIVLWIGQAVALSPHQNLIIGFTEKRMIVAGKKWTSRYSLKPRNVEGGRTEGNVTFLTIKSMGVPPMQLQIERLPSHVLNAFLIKQSPPFAPRTQGSPAATFWRAASAQPRPPGHEPPESVAAAPIIVGSWREAEEFAAWHMRSLGFHDARVTNAGSDGGIDATAAGAAAQVKHYESTVIGRPVVQQLRGAAHGVPWAIFYAQSSYTRSAIEYADQTQVALFTYTNSGSVAARSQGAHYLLMQHSQRTSQGVDSFAQFMEAQSKGQQEIDKAVARFADQSRATMERLQNSRGRRQRAAIAQLQKETKTVSDLVALVGSQHRSLREVLNYAKQIRDAASRVKRIRA